MGVGCPEVAARETPGGLHGQKVDVPMDKPGKAHRVKLGLAVLAALLVAGGAALWFKRPSSVLPAVAQEQAVVQTLVASGRVRAPARVQLATPVGGLVREVLVNEGDHVKEGAELVRLVTEEAQASVEQARAAVAQARARLQQVREVGRNLAQQGVLQAEAQVQRADRSLQRSVVLRREGGGSALEEDEAGTVRTVARSQEAVARTQLAASQSRGADTRVAEGVLQAALAQVRAAEARLAMMRVRAPVDGTVLLRSVEPGEVVGASSVLLVLAPDGPTQLTVQLDERNLSTVHLGAQARASADAFVDQPFDAQVQFIAPQVDPLRGTVEMHLDVPAPPAFLRPEMTVSVEVETGRVGRALTVPEDAVQDLSAAHPTVLLVQDGRVVKRDVTLGLRGQGVVEVRTGLQNGDAVVPPKDGLAPGARVRIKSAPRVPAAGH